MRTRTAALAALLIAGFAVSGCNYDHPGHDSDRHDRHDGRGDRGGYDHGQDGGRGDRGGDH